MHHSSETIGKLAAALAVAQKQIENPQKALTATIPSPFPREGTVSFRYASLASGLDIVRKALGEQEIAAIQRTEIDNERGLIRLNTVLAHSSGEWIASDWPVCATTEVGAPHRLGAALTYARRHALFALVGIAGEDDLDASDLPIASTPNGPKTSSQSDAANQRSGSRKRAVLNSERSASLRDQLLSELSTLGSVDDFTLWALRRLPLKNRLDDSDASLVEAAYENKLASITADLTQETTLVGRTKDVTQKDENISKASRQTRSSEPQPFEPTFVQLPKTLRQRDKAHLIFVASHPCLVCQRTPCDAHHLRFSQPRALGRKVSDEFTVPLCREHHRALHRAGNERRWWADAGIAPLERAQDLWAESLSARNLADSSTPPPVP